MNLNVQFLDRDLLAQGVERIERRFADGWPKHIAAGRGWHPLLIELDDVLARLDPEYRVCQIKEKYGTLRWYLDDRQSTTLDCCADLIGQLASDAQWAEHEATPEHQAEDTANNLVEARGAITRELMEKVIARYEFISAHICESCGQPGTLRVFGGWYATRCATHQLRGGGEPDVEPTTYDTANGTLTGVHQASDCQGKACCVHRPSAHPMRDWPQYWDASRRSMQRVCAHGVLHPDPDEGGRRLKDHECDGCCSSIGEL